MHTGQLDRKLSGHFGEVNENVTLSEGLIMSTKVLTSQGI